MSPDDGEFDEQAYLRRYRDVAAAVKAGSLKSGWQHFQFYGRKEGRSGGTEIRLDLQRWWTPEKDDLDRFGRLMQPVNFRSLNDLNGLITSSIDRFYGKYDFIVGIPRSGLIPASIIALQLNKPVWPIEAILTEKDPVEFTHRKVDHSLTSEENKPRVLFVDDSIGAGTAYKKLCENLKLSGASFRFDIDFLAIYSTRSSSKDVSYLQVVEQPRIFEWNMLHHDLTSRYCVDLDGVICCDPTIDENDENERYLSFLENSKPRVIPTRKVGAIVTARLEKFRPQTEAWLARNGVKYERLIMLDLPSGAERRRLHAHAKFKADVYKTLGGILFIESDLAQAKQIYELTGDPVFCTGKNCMLSG